MGVFDTPLFFGIMSGVICIEVILVEVAGQIFSCTPLSMREWLLSFMLAGLTLPVGFLIRRLPVRAGAWKFGAQREDNQRLLR
jgi:hypothetical protein